MKRICYILVLLFSFTGFGQNNALFERGNTLYNKGNYSEAIEAYKTILESKNHSAELYYNLGNAYYKLNDLAPSIYYYEKALQLAPNDHEIKINLAFAQNMTIDAIDVMPEAGLSKFIKVVTNYMTFDGWAKTSVVLMICFVLLILAYYFAYSTFWKRLAFIMSMVSIGLLVMTLTLAFHKFNLDKNNQPAIVFAKESEVKAEPNLRSEASFTLHEGTKVQVLDTIQNWKKIKLADGKMGWIPKEDIKAL